MKKTFFSFIGKQIMTIAKQIENLDTSSDADHYKYMEKRIKNIIFAIYNVLEGRFSDIASEDKAQRLNKYFHLAKALISEVDYVIKNKENSYEYDSLSRNAYQLVYKLTKNIVKYQSWCKGEKLKECRFYESEFARLLRELQK